MKRLRQPAESAQGQQDEARQALIPSTTGFQLVLAHHPAQTLAQGPRVQGDSAYPFASLSPCNLSWSPSPQSRGKRGSVSRDKVQEFLINRE